MNQIGYFALLATMFIAFYAAVTAVIGGLRGRKAVIASAENAVLSVAGLMIVSAATLIRAFVASDFSLKYVYDYSDRALPLVYKISGFWAGNSGSLLMWALFIGIFGGILILQNRHKNRELMPWIIGVLMTLVFFFSSLMIFMANPFEQLGYPVADGRGLNPMLENPGMYLHPPTTYLGYVGFGIPFAFAIAALITGKLSDVWIRTTRRWAVFAWFFLTLGNLVGAWWAYYTLGWGGYWAWDPVENASFMPWLVGSAYLHSVMIQEKKGMLKIWNMMLIVLTFALTILGTMITRSGIINSVHTFSNSGLGPYLFGFFLLIIIGSFGLLIYRLPELKTENEIDSLVSRESAFLFNNLILLAMAFTVLWGTTFPFISEALTGAKVTVGPPFFDQVIIPLGMALLFLIGFCPLIAWRRASTANLQKNFLNPLIVSFVGAIVMVAQGLRNTWVLVAAVLAVFVTATIVIEFYRGTRARRNMTGEDYFTSFVNLIWRNKRRYGGYIIHIGVVLVFVAIMGGPFKIEKDLTLSPGQQGKIGPYVLKYERLMQLPQEGRMTLATSMSVLRNGRRLGTVTPRKEFFEPEPGEQQPREPWTRVGVRSTSTEDLYIILVGGDAKDPERVLFRAIINPMMQWMWIAGFVMAFGTIIVIWPDPYEKRRLAMVYSREAAIETA